MSKTWIKALALVAVALLVVPAAYAQTTGRIEGRVVGEEGDALPGVTVQIESAALQGERIDVTDADGRFRFVALPVGTYNLRASLEGFGILEQQDIAVRLDRTVTLQLQMSQAFGEEVTVSGIAPIIDTTSTTGGASFDQQLFQDLPTTRTFTGLAFAAPGVVDGGLGQNPSIGGASAAENRYVIDGLDVTDPAFGTVGTTVPQEFVREVEVKTGGYEAEYSGALGGVLNVITKSGGNELEGQVFGYYSDESLQETAPAVDQVGEFRGYEEYDFGAALGGKIIQDKLWYFVAANPSFRDDFVTTRGGIDDTEEEEQLFYSGKLTFQVNPNHQIVASTFGDPIEQNDTILNSYGRIGTDDEFGAESYGLTYNGTLGSSLFMEASAGFYSEDVSVVPYNDVPRYQFNGVSEPVLTWLQDANCAPLDSYLGDNFTVFNGTLDPSCVGATFATDLDERERDEFRGSMTWFGETGTIDHEVKFGALYRDVFYHDVSRYPGATSEPLVADALVGENFDFVPNFVIDSDGLKGQRWILIPQAGLNILFEYDQDSQGSTEETAIFAQDSLRINDYFTLNLGVRADTFNSEGELSGQATGLARELDFDYGDMVAPRIGFTWDVFQNGRSKLYGHFGQFYESVPLDINVRAFGNERFNLYYFLFPEDGSIPTAQNPGIFLEPYTYVLGGGTGVDPDIEPMYTEEILAGFEYEILPNVAVGIKGTVRDINNVIEDISVDGGRTYYITNPGGSVDSNPVTGAPLDETVIFPDPTREYEAVELTLNKRFSNNWQLFGSAVYSKNEGNYGGLFRQDNGQLDPNITSLYDLPELLNGAFGLLPNDREYQFKLYGSYVWPFRMTTGFYFQYLDGTPISQLGAHPIYGQNERFVTPRGSFGRTPDVWSLDLSIQYPISFGNGIDLQLLADVFNVTDEAEPTAVDQTWTFERLFATPDPPDPQTNTSFGEPLAYQQPRTIRLGARLSF